MLNQKKKNLKPLGIILHLKIITGMLFKYIYTFLQWYTLL